MLRRHGLLLTNLALFLVFVAGMTLTGWQVASDERLEHGAAALTLLQYLASGNFGEALFENWESEFLQMGTYVVLTAILFQKGSSESKPLDGPAPQDADPRDSARDPRAPWPVRRGGLALLLYENSLTLLFFVLFAASITLHAVTGAAAYSEEQLQHGGTAVSVGEFVLTAQFWFESFQNWQSEFLAIAVIVLGSVFLRQRGSAESKPVAAPHAETGS